MAVCLNYSYMVANEGKSMFKWRIRYVALLVFMWFGLSTVLAQTSAPIKLAVHPYASTLALVNIYRPLQQYLEESLHRRVEFYTAANFDAFSSSLLAGEYDIVMSPPHFALMAMEKDYVGLLHFQARLEPLLTVRKDSGLISAGRPARQAHRHGGPHRVHPPRHHALARRERAESQAATTRSWNVRLTPDP